MRRNSRLVGRSFGINAATRSARHRRRALRIRSIDAGQVMTLAATDSTISRPSPDKYKSL